MKQLFFLTALLIFIFLKSSILSAQCSGSAFFEISPSLCLGEGVSLNFGSNNYKEIEWDFFSGDLDQNLVSPATNLNNPSGIINGLEGVSVLKENGNYYAFVVMNNPLKIIRLNLGSSLQNASILSVVDLGNPFNVMTAGNHPIRFYENFGFLSDGSRLIQFNFSNGISNPPTSFSTIENTVLSEFSTAGNLRIVKDMDSIFLFVANDIAPRHISVLTFGTNINSTPTLIRKITNLNIISAIRNAVDLDFIKICNKWQGYYVTNNGQFLILDFGASLFNEPVKLLSNTLSLNAPRFLKIEYEANSIFMFVQLSNGRLNKFNLGSDGLNLSPTEFLYTNISGGNNSKGFEIIKENSTWHVISANRNTNSLYHTNFQNNSIDSTSINNQFAVTELPYNSSGTYYIGLRATDSLDNVSSWIDTVEILNNLQPSFTFEGSCIDFSTQFVENVTLNGLNITNRKWSFGNGDTSSLENPSYQFSNIGTFDVEFSLTASNGCQNSFSNSIFITDIRPENPSFEYAPNIICENTLIDFTNTTTTSIDSVVSVLWNFGDGNFSTDFSPTYSYTTAGNYTTSLTLKGKFGCDTTISQSISVRPGPLPDFEFQNLCFGDEVIFTDLSSSKPPSEIVLRQWDFGDGSLIQTTVNASHTYLNSGSFNPILTIQTDSGCISSISKNIFIENLPTPYFTFPVICANSLVVLESSSPGNLVDWQWETSSGSSYSGSQVSVSFDTNGETEVTLTATTASGCLGSTTQTIEIFPALLPDFTFENLCLGDSVRFNDITPSFSVVDRLWSFGQPNAFASGITPAYQYTSAGIYNTTLTVENAIGCVSSITKPVEIFQLPLVAILSDPACINSEIFLRSNLSTNFNDLVSNFKWSINNSLIENEETDSISVVFDELGIYAVTLEIETQGGCIATVTENIEVLPLPVASFTFTPNYGTAPQIIQFTNQSTGALFYNWSFGDGTGESFDLNPVYTYTSNNNYLVVLEAFSADGCVGLAQRNVPIIPSELDIELSNLVLQTIVNTSGTALVKPRLTVSNIGTRSIESIDFYMRLNEQVEVFERWEGNLPPAASFTFEFSSQYALTQGINARYICVEARDVNDGSEINLENNKVCKVLNGQVQLSEIYPNPAKELAYLDMITETSGSADLVLYEISGKKIFEIKGYLLERGFNKIILNLNLLQSGKYFLSINYLNDNYVKPIVIMNK